MVSPNTVRQWGTSLALLILLFVGSIQMPVIAAATDSDSHPAKVDLNRADQAELEINEVPDLRERRLFGSMAPADDWRESLAHTWADFDWAPPGGETSAVVQARVNAALLSLAAAHPGETIVAASHGNAIALFLNSIDPSFGFDEWKDLRNPDLFLIPYGGNGPESFERIPH